MNLLAEKLVELEQRRIFRLFVEMPPRHGKSELCSHYFPAWYLGRNPDHNVILCSYESSFAATWGEKVRDTMIEWAPEVFGVSVHPKRRAAHDWRMALPHLGRMRCVGVEGGITGRGAHLIVIDDPIKDSADANSEVKRRKAWDWYTTTARSRLEPNGIIVVIQTRWNEDDLIGKLRQAEAAGGEKWETLTLPAIHDDGPVPDAIGRYHGEALWPWRYDIDGLEAIRKTIPGHWWEALYQQRPTPPGGSLAQSVWFKPVESVPDKSGMTRVRFWDCAGTMGGGDWTVGTLMARDGDRFYIEDVIRVQLSAGPVDDLIYQTAMRDGRKVRVREEREPGSSGLAVINARAKRLRGFNYKGKPAKTAKVNRWQPLLTEAEHGYVYIQVASWNKAFLEQVGSAPFGRHDDMLDSASGAYEDIVFGKANVGVF